MKLSQILMLILMGCFSYYGCTNLALNQTGERFKENMEGSLRGFTDINIATPNNFTFIAMGDTHIGAPGGTLMKKALQMGKAAGDSFAVMAGDNSNTGLDAELRSFQAQIEEVGLTSFPAIGNHDIFFGGWANYKTIIGRSIYSINAGDAHLVFLDTANGTFGEQQIDWLTRDLAATTKPIKIVIAHFPIFVGHFSTIYKLSSDEEATLFRQIMNDNGVQLVIAGHYHGYAEKQIGFTKYIVTGGANNILDIGESKHFIRVRINNGAVSTTQVSLD